MDGFKKIGAALALVAGLLLLTNGLRPRPPVRTHSASKIHSGARLTQPITHASATAGAKELRRPAQDVKAGLVDMSNALFRFTRPGQSLKDLTDFLERENQQPVTTHNSNEDTGEMAIVRTRRPLAGTRYFHAQYFSDANQNSFVQHMSFEFQPGPTAMSDTVEAVQRSFSLGPPEVQRGDYALWNLADGRILWVKKMSAEDLQDDPFNAYSSNDVGTVRVAIETEIH